MSKKRGMSSKVDRCGRRVKAKYTDYGDNFWKNENNKWFEVEKDTICVVLDNETLDSARKQIGDGVLPENIHVVEIDLNTFQKMVKFNDKKKLGVNLHLGCVSECIDQIPGPIGGMYMDFMGNTKSLKIFYDVLDACKGKLCKNAIIALTLNTRLRVKDSTIKETLATALNEISRITKRKAFMERCTGYSRDEDEKVMETTQTMAFAVFGLDRKKGEPWFRPIKILKYKIKGSDIDDARGQRINRKKYYDLVKWSLYPKDLTWEPHLSIV